MVPGLCGTVYTCQDKFQYHFMIPSGVCMTDDKESTGQTPHGSCPQTEGDTLQLFLTNHGLERAYDKLPPPSP